MDDAQKLGARNNAGDKARVREIRKAARAIVDHTTAIEPEDEDMPKAEMHLGSQPIKADMTIDLPEIMLQWVTVKAGVEEWTLDVLGVPFGGPFNGKDRQNEYFDANTKIYQDFYKEIPAVYAHGAQPNGKPAAKPVIVGKAKYSHQDEKGHWYTVVLDRLNEFAKRVWDAAKSGKAGASSGSIMHMTRVQKDGRITEWPVAEMTLVDVGTSNMIPVNPYAVALPAMKAVYDQAGLTLPDLENQPDGEQAQDDGKGDEQPITQPVKGGNQSETLGVIEMETQDLIKLLDERDAAKAAQEAKAQEAKAVEELRKENEALKAEAAKARRLPGMPLVSQFSDTNKYDHMSAAELALAIEMQGNISATGKMPHVSPSAVKALMLKVARIENDKVSSDTAVYVKGALKAHLNSDLSDEAIKAATDPAYSTLSSYGAEWVGTAYSNQIWEAIRAPLNIVGRIPSVVIPDGYSSEYFPLESTDPVWYKVAEVTAADSTMKVPVATVINSQMGTGSKQITVAKMGARAMYSGELTEDSLINYAPQLRAQLEVSGREMMEYVVIDGDTATSSNINDIGGTTYSGAATSLFLLTNGFRKSPLVTTTTQSRSAAGGFVAEDFIATLKLLGSNGIGASNPQQCAYIVDPNTWYAAAQLPEAKDANQTIFVVQDGFVKRAYGVEVLPSWMMHKNSSTRKANTAGKVDQDTAGNNAYGAIVAVRFDQWKLAYKRRMTMETTRFANSDSWEVVALTRWGLGQRDTVAAAETYYVGI